MDVFERSRLTVDDADNRPSNIPLQRTGGRAPASPGR
jgi:hypothetical protein